MLDVIPLRSTILQIVQNSEITKKKRRHLRSIELEETLIQWIWKMFEQNVIILNEIILCKANKILNHINSNNPIAELHLSFSNG